MTKWIKGWADLIGFFLQLLAMFMMLSVIGTEKCVRDRVRMQLRRYRRWKRRRRLRQHF